MIGSSSSSLSTFSASSSTSPTRHYCHLFHHYHRHHHHVIIVTTWDGPALRHSKVCRKIVLESSKLKRRQQMEYRQLPRLNICFRLGKEVTDDHGWVQTSEIKDGDVKVWKKNTCKAERLESESLKVKVKVWKKNTCKAGRLESESLKVKVKVWKKNTCKAERRPAGPRRPWAAWAGTGRTATRSGRTVGRSSTAREAGRAASSPGREEEGSPERLERWMLRPHICHFFSPQMYFLGSIFLHMKVRKLWQNLPKLLKISQNFPKFLQNFPKFLHMTIFSPQI